MQDRLRTSTPVVEISANGRGVKATRPSTTHDSQSILKYNKSADLRCQLKRRANKPIRLALNCIVGYKIDMFPFPI